MSLHTRIMRNGEPLQLQWSSLHLHAMFTVNEEEGGALKSEGKHVAQRKYVFTQQETGERFVILPGDVLEAWR